MNEREVRKKLSEYRVGIAGCGGLGSNCAVALARAGIGHLVLADFDLVEESNLNRQYYFRSQVGIPKVEALSGNIQRIDTGVGLTLHYLRLDPENIPLIFKGCDVVVEAFDKADQKVMIIETMLEKMQNIPIVSGSGMAGWGEFHLLRTEKHENLYVCGDQMKEVSETLPVLAPRVGIVANMQANMVLEILLGK